MKIAAPRMGRLELMLGDLFQRLEIDFLESSKITNKTLKIGLQHSPEFACLPLKLTIGSFVESLEAGADTLIMAGGCGPCRFGYYCEIQRLILKKYGYKFELVVLEPPGVGLRDFIGTFRRFAPNKSTWELLKIVRTSYFKGQIFDEIEKKVLQARAFEANYGDTLKAQKEADKIVSEAFTKEEIKKAREEAFSVIDSVEKGEKQINLRIGIVGEFYMLLEPFANFDIEKWLGERGIYLERAVYITDWIGPLKKNSVYGINHKKIEHAAEPYLKHFVGGDGLSSVGNTVIFSERGFDGVIHLLPFTCMPELIAKSIIARASKEKGIPVLSLVIDEQTGKAGMTTRLEAFLDLISHQKRRKN